MHRLCTPFAVLASLLAASVAAAQSPQSQAPTAPPPPKTNPVTAPPAPTGQWVWQPTQQLQPPISPIQPVMYVAVQQPYQPVQAPQPVVYAAQQPVAAVSTISAGAPVTIQLGGGFLSAGLTHVGQKLVQLGSTRTTLVVQRQRTLVGLPAPTTTYATTYTVQQPVQTQVVQVQQPYQPVTAPPPPAQPPSDGVPPPVGPPAHPSPQTSGSGQPPRRVGLFGF
jgi:hypothetical protein